MTGRDTVELLVLAALWGAAFLFMRVAVPDFGPVVLAFVRVAGAAAVLLPLLARRGQLGELRRHAGPILIVGVTNSALPFFLFSFAALAISAGLSSIFNATTPLWAAVIAWLWLGDRLLPIRWFGLALGFAGVGWLAVDKGSLSLQADAVSPALAVAACVLAAFFYGFSANYTKRRLGGASGPPPLAIAAGSQLGATLALALPAWWFWPSEMPGLGAWGAAATLALACTALAYILYFRLIAHAGPANASAVTFLIPAFAVSWGMVFLGEVPTAVMLSACVVILIGTALATGLWRPFGRA